MVRHNIQLQNFCESFLFEQLIKKPTCYKGHKLTVIDHIIKMISKRIMKSMVLETSKTNHHKMILVFFVLYLQKVNPKVTIAAAKRLI